MHPGSHRHRPPDAPDRQRRRPVRAGWLRPRRAEAAPPAVAPAKSVILFWLSGGVSHIDTVLPLIPSDDMISKSGVRARSNAPTPARPRTKAKIMPASFYCQTDRVPAVRGLQLRSVLHPEQAKGDSFAARRKPPPTGANATASISTRPPRCTTSASPLTPGSIARTRTATPWPASSSWSRHGKVPRGSLPHHRKPGPPFAASISSRPSCWR